VKESDVTVITKYEVECRVCGEGVEAEEFYTRYAAEEARKNHMREHDEGMWLEI
jgi:hypothetical protein